jgi:predicted Zn-dependent peptidase
MWDLRAKDRLAYNVTSNLTARSGAGLLEAYLETEAAKTEKAREALVRTLSEFFENGLTTAELARGQTILKANYVRANESKGSRTTLLGMYEALGLGSDLYAGFAAEVQTLTLDEVNAFIRSALDPARASWVVVGPAK